ncbi:response regulator transcription factor [Bifidobacterium pseudolongum]|uniref:response regulator transcription factor n=1 Tax=Bifidobacterium pseudolongum TaxID=1694 RepID=UPI0013EB3888|nr:response regulator transcription factor [Bifidobacterium pseudolongum]
MDNDALVLGALQYVVRTYLPQSEVIWKETDGNRAVSLCSTPATTPDALIVDASLEGMTGSEVCRRIRANDAEIVLVGVTSFILDRFHDAMMDSGAQCLLPKDRPQAICQAVMALCECRIPDDVRFSTESAAEAHRRLSEEQQVNPVRAVMLSPREEEVMTWIDLGKSSSWIAKRLNTSESTIKTYAQRIYTKLGVRTKVEAIIAWRNRRSE